MRPDFRFPKSSGAPRFQVNLESQCSRGLSPPILSKLCFLPTFHLCFRPRGGRLPFQGSSLLISRIWCRFPDARYGERCPTIRIADIELNASHPRLLELRAPPRSLSTSRSNIMLCPQLSTSLWPHADLTLPITMNTPPHTDPSSIHPTSYCPLPPNSRIIRSSRRLGTLFSTLPKSHHLTAVRDIL